MAAIAEVLFVDGQFTAGDIQAIERHRIIDDRRYDRWSDVRWNDDRWSYVRRNYNWWSYARRNYGRWSYNRWGYVWWNYDRRHYVWWGYVWWGYVRWSDDRRSLFNRIIVIAAISLQAWNFGNAIEASCRKADDRIHVSADLAQQHETMPAAATARATATRPCCRGLGFLGRVTARRNGFLKLLDIGQLSLARGCGIRRYDMRGIVIGERFGRQVQAAVTPQGQLFAILQMNRSGAGRTRFQLFAGKQSVAFDQRTTATVAGHCEHLADHFADHTD
jgi:hypothetical protein